MNSYLGNMFIKKDRRRIEEILQDKDDDRKSLHLSRRVAEFHGTIKPLCKEIYLPALQNLTFLNLYDNALTNVSSIQFLSQTPIEEINLGRNNLSTLPTEVPPPIPSHHHAACI